MEEVHKSCDLAEVSAQYTLSIQSISQGLTYLLIDSPHEKVQWESHTELYLNTTTNTVPLAHPLRKGSALHFTGCALVYLRNIYMHII